MQLPVTAKLVWKQTEIFLAISAELQVSFKLMPTVKQNLRSQKNWITALLDNGRSYSVLFLVLDKSSEQAEIAGRKWKWLCYKPKVMLHSRQQYTTNLPQSSHMINSQAWYSVWRKTKMEKQRYHHAAAWFITGACTDGSVCPLMYLNE